MEWARWGDADHDLYVLFALYAARTGDKLLSGGSELLTQTWTQIEFELTRAPPFWSSDARRPSSTSPLLSFRLCSPLVVYLSLYVAIPQPLLVSRRCRRASCPHTPPTLSRLIREVEKEERGVFPPTVGRYTPGSL